MNGWVDGEGKKYRENLCHHHLQFQIGKLRQIRLAPQVWKGRRLGEGICVKFCNEIFIIIGAVLSAIIEGTGRVIPSKHV